MIILAFEGCNIKIHNVFALRLVDAFLFFVAEILPGITCRFVLAESGDI